MIANSRDMCYDKPRSPQLQKEGVPMNFKILAIIVLTLVYLYHLALAWLDRKGAVNPVPINVADVYDRDTYFRWRSYSKEKSTVMIVERTLGFIISLLLFIPDVYARFAGLFPEGAFFQLFAVLLLESLTDIVLLPVSWYDTMVVEEKYGFNRTNAKTFFLDAVKSFVISLVFMVFIALLLMWIYQSLGKWMILVFAAVMTLLFLGLTFLYPFFSKIFNKFTPLEDGELKNSLTGLLGRHGYTVRAIQVMDGSKRSTRSNAYFTGFGKMKTIVLFDTLVQSMTPDEICAVFAHEMGHGLHRDTLKNQLMSALQMLILAVAAWLTLSSPGLFASFGFSDINYGFALILILSVEYALISPLVSLVMNALSRRAEFRADRQAVSEGFGQALIDALKKLARENFADLAPDPLLVRLTYSHPPISERVSAIQRALK